MELLLAVPFGVAIGVVVGTVGGGGAILALPILVYVLDEGVGPATTASLIVVALGASVGAGARAREGIVCWNVAIAFALPAMAGAYLGTLAGGEASPRTLILAFIPVMAVAAVVTYRRGDAAADEPDEERSPCPRTAPAPTLAAGLAVGAMTGFFGVGGGFLIVPALTGLLGLPIKRAIATSLAVITLTGLAALASHLAEGAAPDWPLTLVLCAAAAAGAVYGSTLAKRLEERTLAHLFGILVGVLALALLIDAILLGGPPTS